jgi:putative flippase GtrA
MEFARFAAVGVTNTALTWIIYLVLAGYRHIDPVVANVVAWTISSAWSFTWNRRFTFRSHEANVRGQAARFVAVNLSAIGVSTLIIALFRHHPLWVGQAFATAATLAWNYAMCRRVVFPQRNGTA